MSLETVQASVGATTQNRDCGSDIDSGRLLIYKYDSDWYLAESSASPGGASFDGPGAHAYMGECVAMSEDGMTVMVGMPSKASIQHFGGMELLLGMTILTMAHQDGVKLFNTPILLVRMVRNLGKK